MPASESRFHGIFALLSALFLLSGAHAAPPATGLTDAEALRDRKVAKGVFMLDVKDPGRTAHILKVIEETG